MSNNIKYPYLCPVCQGHGNVSGGFYMSSPGCAMLSTVTQEQCRSCHGTGIVWSES